MKFIKMLGLAAVAASALMALVGAGSASATALCSSAPSGSPLACPAGTALLKGTKILGTQTKNGVLTTSAGTITCKKSHFEDELTSEPATGKIVTDKTLALSFSECTTTIGGCTVKAVNVANGGAGFATEIEYLSTTAPQGAFRIVHPTTTVELVNCFLGVSAKCVYASEDTVKGSLLNGKEENLEVENAVVKSKSGGLCPAEGKETVGYHVTQVGGGAVFVADH